MSQTEFNPLLCLVSICSSSIVHYVSKACNQLGYSSMRVWRVILSLRSPSTTHTPHSIYHDFFILPPLIYQLLSSFFYYSILRHTAILSHPESKFLKKLSKWSPELYHSISFHLYDPPFFVHVSNTVICLKKKQKTTMSNYVISFKAFIIFPMLLE